ncbi:MAG: Asp-tRNA(Asn)/Glu-tRNA(Gln) amidotransferase subunit GatB [Bacteroidetes bacterium]|nr:Asp-tRNA(Asn)/Glu-tRNA(Gln) amidotransferase subunit GatB [Bacteroidota bacterium]
MKYKLIIGLEIHLQLATASKMFCDCPNISLEEKPNINICSVCLGQPGALPILNEKALEMILKLGLALNGQIQRKFYFERKNYFYPDLPKGYQISQKKVPIIKNAEIDLGEKQVKIIEIHLEEDTGKIYHQDDGVNLDFNRAGVPLIEIVSAPEIETARQAKEYCEEIQAIARTLGISEANMEKGEMRCEVNVSLNSGERVEIKNLNSFRAVERSIEYEIKRQTKVLEEGGFVFLETRGWDEKNNKTISQRKKEESGDYRYFPEPDLPVFEIDDDLLKKIKKLLPELPSEKRKKLTNQYGFSQLYAKILSREDKILKFVEETMEILKSKMVEITEGDDVVDEEKMSKKVGDWIINKLFGMETTMSNKFYEKIKASDFADFMFLVLSRRIFSNQMAENILKKMYKTGETAEEVLNDESMQKTDDCDQIKKTVELVLENYPEVVVDYKKGKKSVIKYLLGQAMFATHGKVEPKKLEKMILKYLEE